MYASSIKLPHKTCVSAAPNAECVCVWGGGKNRDREGGGEEQRQRERERGRESIQNQQTNSFPLAERKANIKPFSALLVLPLGGLRSIKRNMIRVNILVATRNEEKRVI